MTLEADDLLLFARVIEAGSFSRAAERVQLPKSTVSRRIAALEQRLGETYRPVSPFDTVERRLEDLEKDVEDLKRR